MSDAARLRHVAGDLEQELAAFDAIVAEISHCLSDLEQRSPTSLEVRGAGDLAHDCYNAIEHFFERVAVELDGGLPAGKDWHATLLGRMARDVAGVRPAVISVDSRTHLDELMRFRYLFRHRYGFALEWNKIQTLLREVAERSTGLRSELQAFIATVRELAAALEP